MPCPRCESLPPALPKEGTLYYAPPEGATARELEARLTALGCSVEQSEPGIYHAVVDTGKLKELFANGNLRLSNLQMEDTRSLLLPLGVEATIQALVRMQPLAALKAAIEGDALREILREGRLRSYFHPIVPAASPGTAFAYECLLRGFDQAGNIVPPRSLFEPAEAADLLFYLDRAARLQAIHDAHVHGVSQRLFINFNPSAIYDPAYCLQTTMAAIDACSLSRDQVVFEVVESERIRDTGHLIAILRFYQANGFGVALDDLGAGYSSLNLLHQIRPDFVKLDLELIRGVDADPFKAQLCANLLALAQDLGIPSIAEGVETHGEFDWLREHGAAYMQGYLFARPAAEPPAPAVP